MSEVPLHVAGASIAVIAPNKDRTAYDLLAILRDDKGDIAYPNMWEFPGGGLEPIDRGNPMLCALRELREEGGLRLSEQQVIWEAFYPRAQQHASDSLIYNAFYVAEVSAASWHQPRKGDEGKECRWMPAGDFTGRRPEAGVQAIPDHIDRYYDFIHGINGRRLGHIASQVGSTPQAA